ncbi:MAG: hypothetical protein M1838_000926 [Thelocarpon superellum]|nr:MAG: hypothetical protein M1838_000926 [Thelocarpon superellum]
MAEIPVQAPPGLEDAYHEPPSKKIRLESPAADASPPRTPSDDMDDIYGTPSKADVPHPLFIAPSVSHTEVQTQQTDGQSPAAIPQKTASVIPGLGLLVASSSSFHDNAKQLATGTVIAETVATSDGRDGVQDAHDIPATSEVHPPVSLTDAAGDLAASPSRDDATPLVIDVGGEKPAEDPEWEADSSNDPASSSDNTSSSSGSSSDEEDGDGDDYELLDPEEQARILMQGEGGSDDEGGGPRAGKAGGTVRTKNEVIEDFVAKPDVVIPPEMRLQALGVVQSLIDNIILIQAHVSGEYQVLETGSVLCLEDRTVIGAVAEPLGRVQQPMYSVRFNSHEEIAEAGVVVGTTVYYVDAFATYVFTQPLQAMKGSDASNLHDEEVGDDELEFSDDEAEAEYKRRVKQERQARRGGSRFGSHAGPARHAPQTTTNNHALSYDDLGPRSDAAEANVEDDLYTPLARPTNFEELMRSHDVPAEVRRGRDRGDLASRGGRGRGRGRGMDRGRGQRGGMRGDRRSVADVARGRHERDYRDGWHGHRQDTSTMPSQQHPGTDLPAPVSAGPASALSTSPTPTFYPSSTHTPMPYAPFYSPPPPPPPPTWPSHPTMPAFPSAAHPSLASFFNSSPPPPSPGGSLPAGAFVNPAFFRGHAPPAMPGQWSPAAPSNSGSTPQTQSPGAPAMSPESDAAFRAAQEKLDILKGLTRKSPG